MKKILLITLIAVSSILSMEAADAAAELVIRSFVQPTTPVATSRTASFRIDNIGDATSQAFKVRIWASKDKAFSDVPDDGEVFEANSNSVSSSGSGLDGDTPVPLSPINDEGFYAGIQPTVSLPGRGIFWTVSWTLTYDLPLPGDLTPGGKPKPLSSILGDQANFKICIVLINETQCDSAPTSLRQVQSTLVPPIVNDVRVVGSSENELQLTWMEVPFDTFVDDNDVAQEVDFVSKYRIKRLDHLGVTTSTELRPDELDVVMVDGQERFSLTFQLSNDLPRGKRNAFEVESCHDAGAPGVKKLVCDPETPRRPGTSFFRDVAAIERPFSATQGSRSDGVLVSWEVPASFVRRYRLMRCDADSQDNCTPTEVDGALTNFLDTNVQRGKIYEYVISACDRLYANSSNPNDPRIGTCLDNDNSIYKFGKTTPGFID